MGSVYTRGRKLWLRFKGPNGWTQRRTDYVVGQEAAARATLDRLEERLREGTATALDFRPTTVIDYYRTTWIKERELEIQTWKNDEGSFRLHVLPTLGKVRLDQVKPMHVVSLVREWRREMAPKSVHNSYSTLSAFFRDACLADL